MTFLSVLAVALGVSLAGLGARTAHAQPAKAPTAQVAFVESLPTRGARAEIVRFPDGTRPPLVLLDARGSTRDDVMAALIALEQARRRPAPRPGTHARLAVMSARDASGVAATYGARADRIIQEIRGAPLARIGNLGVGRWIEIDATR